MVIFEAAFSSVSWMMMSMILRSSLLVTSPWMKVWLNMLKSSRSSSHQLIHQVKTGHCNQCCNDFNISDGKNHKSASSEWEIFRPEIIDAKPLVDCKSNQTPEQAPAYTRTGLTPKFLAHFQEFNWCIKKLWGAGRIGKNYHQWVLISDIKRRAPQVINPCKVKRTSKTEIR